MSTFFRSSALRVALLVYILLAVFAGAGFREDELRCEEALVHLDDCCPSLDITVIACSYYSSGCEDTPTRPLISEEASSCIQEMSCDRVRENQICERVAAAQEERDGNVATGEPPLSTGLCP